jgi:hypothetical protein
MRMAATESTQTGLTGFRVGTWKADRRILHAMYEYLGDAPDIWTIPGFTVDR